MKKGAVVVLESTVYPSVTEEIVTPILENESKMKCGVDFKIGYSPERINPGDEAHSLDRITKIVAGMDDETTETLAVSIKPNGFRIEHEKFKRHTPISLSIQKINFIQRK